MKKAILIESCNVCPYKEHKGAFGAIAYIPRCKKTGHDLPYTLDYSTRNMIIAIPTGAIPKTCPLTDFPEPEPFLQK